MEQPTRTQKYLSILFPSARVPIYEIELKTIFPLARCFQIIKQYNWPHRPVRIFTYLIGGGSGSRDSMHSIACSNKGYFVEVNTPEDARKRVVEYALVMARPMVLYQADHPIHWSPVFVGGKSGNMGSTNEKKRRLVTTVSSPVFDRRNHSVRVANLLGVVGTDVPIEEIIKMIPQYKVCAAEFAEAEWALLEDNDKNVHIFQLGANGYSFIVDNNGKVLYHPDLRPPVSSHHLFIAFIQAPAQQFEQQFSAPKLIPNSPALVFGFRLSFSTRMSRMIKCNTSINCSLSTARSI